MTGFSNDLMILQPSYGNFDVEDHVIPQHEAVWSCGINIKGTLIYREVARIL
jgi:predicted NAD/FAD-binding protein